MNGLSKFTVINPGGVMRKLSVSLFVFSQLLFASCDASESEKIELLRSNAVGDEVHSEHETYKIIPNGDVSLADDNDQLLTSVDATGWSQRLGRFQMSIDQRPSARSASSVVPDSKYQLGFNPRTGRAAVITGQVITRLIEGADAKAIAAEFDLTLTAHFPHLNAAVYQVRYPNMLAQNVSILTADARVTRAYAEVIEKMPTTR